MDGNLALSRKPGDSVDIDGPCRITIIRIGRDIVRIAIQAPQSTNILRTELLSDKDQNTSVEELYCLPSMPPDLA